jgi:AcrR family transcriptional regulator
MGEYGTMTDRDHRLIDAARQVFVRYGVGKSTMADIAREAGVSRQTLYNVYAGKDELLRATVRMTIADGMREVEAAWADCATFDAHLEVFFRLGPLAWYDFAQTSPEAAELMEGIHKIAAEELADAGRIWSARFETLIRAHVPPGHPAQAMATELADFIFATSANAKYGAETRKVLESRLSLLKASVVSLIGSD